MVSQNPDKTQSQPNNILNTVKTWDELCYKAILSELAPKGFKESRDKRFRGTIISTLDMLTKKRVDKTCRIAASLVRGYRERLKAVLDQEELIMNRNLIQAQDLFDNTPFYKFKLKQLRKADVIEWQAQMRALKNAMDKLESVPIK